MSLKKTPLHPVYSKYGAKTIDFGGWDLPVQFTGIKAEHEAVRTKAGLFDVSHMGEIEVKGNRSLAFLQLVMTNDISRLKPGGAMYTTMCYENGGTVDDLIVYQKGEGDYLLVVNAANTDKDYDWLCSHAGDDVEVKNISPEIAQLALQGPLAEDILQKLTDTPLTEIGFFKFRDNVDIKGIKALVARTGYTGEDGFEIYCDASDAVPLWEKIMSAGDNFGLQPIGLGARDTLRFEANLALYGQELSKNITPIEAGLNFVVKTDEKEDFIGKSVLKQQKEQGAPRKLVGVEMIDKAIPRTNYKVYVGDKEIGYVTTGTQSPTLNKNVGLALLSIGYSGLDTDVEVDVRGKRKKAKVVSTPFYKRPKK